MKLPEWIRDSKKAGKFHAIATLVWLVMIPVSVFTPLKDSVPFLVGISLWALVGSHWAAWQAVQAEES